MMFTTLSTTSYLPNISLKVFQTSLCFRRMYHPIYPFISGQIPLKLKFRCYNPVSMHLKTSSEFFKNSNQEIQDTCNEHAQLCENYHPDECPKSHFGGAIFLTIVLTGTVSVNKNRPFNNSYMFENMRDTTESTCNGRYNIFYSTVHCKTTTE